ncbi:MAG: hypothetical protein FWG98_02390 [Candidatus Cloacimonetes bacterium]|nr:hypothetical protein [Candidatus Cloacimonadota bacterium]
MFIINNTHPPPPPPRTRCKISTYDDYLRIFLKLSFLTYLFSKDISTERICVSFCKGVFSFLQTLLKRIQLRLMSISQAMFNDSTYSNTKIKQYRYIGEAI